MAAGTKKSENIVNIETSPISALSKKMGQKKVVIDQVSVATTNTDDIGDIILFGPVPSNAVITSIKLFNDDLDSNGSPTLAANVGLYYSGIGHIDKSKVSGTVVDADCIGTAITTLQAANVSGTEIRFEADDIINVKKEAWEIGGLSSDPGGLLFVGLTLTAAAATGAAGDIVMVIEHM